MSSSWWVWLVGVLVLFAAGGAATLLPRLRVAGVERRTAWSAAHAAIDTASVSRDAASGTVPEAEQLLARAEAVAARRGGRAAAETAAGYARRADRLWREATHG